jgi:hypothetical protein
MHEYHGEQPLRLPLPHQRNPSELVLLGLPSSGRERLTNPHPSDRPDSLTMTLAEMTVPQGENMLARSQLFILRSMFYGQAWHTKGVKYTYQDANVGPVNPSRR